MVVTFFESTMRGGRGVTRAGMDTTQPWPAVPPTDYDVGFQTIGRDGNMWHVSRTKDPANPTRRVRMWVQSNRRPRAQRPTARRPATGGARGRGGAGARARSRTTLPAELRTLGRSALYRSVFYTPLQRKDIKAIQNKIKAVLAKRSEFQEAYILPLQVLYSSDASKRGKGVRAIVRSVYRHYGPVEARRARERASKIAKLRADGSLEAFMGPGVFHQGGAGGPTSDPILNATMRSVEMNQERPWNMGQTDVFMDFATNPAVPRPVRVNTQRGLNLNPNTSRWREAAERLYQRAHRQNRWIRRDDFYANLRRQNRVVGRDMGWNEGVLRELERIRQANGYVSPPRRHGGPIQMASTPKGQGAWGFLGRVWNNVFGASAKKPSSPVIRAPMPAEEVMRRFPRERHIMIFSPIG